jgi:hypothetical protein
VSYSILPFPCSIGHVLTLLLKFKLLSLCTPLYQFRSFRVAHSVVCHRDVAHSVQVSTPTDSFGARSCVSHCHRPASPFPHSHFNSSCLDLPVVYLVFVDNLLLPRRGLDSYSLRSTGVFFGLQVDGNNHDHGPCTLSSSPITRGYILRRTIRRENTESIHDDGSVRGKATALRLFKSVVLYGGTLHKLLSN